MKVRDLVNVRTGSRETLGLQLLPVDPHSSLALLLPVLTKGFSLLNHIE